MIPQRSMTIGSEERCGRSIRDVLPLLACLLDTPNAWGTSGQQLDALDA